jgi:hypothetical protein
MASAEIRRQERFEARLAAQAAADPIHNEILEEFAQLQGHVTPVPFRRGAATKQTLVDLDEPVRRQGVIFVGLNQIEKAEKGKEKCPYNLKNCHLDPSCNYKVCLRLDLIGRES